MCPVLVEVQFFLVFSLAVAYSWCWRGPQVPSSLPTLKLLTLQSLSYQLLEWIAESELKNMHMNHVKSFEAIPEWEKRGNQSCRTHLYNSVLNFIPQQRVSLSSAQKVGGLQASILFNSGPFAHWMDWRFRRIRLLLLRCNVPWHWMVLNLNGCHAIRCLVIKSSPLRTRQCRRQWDATKVWRFADPCWRLPRPLHAYRGATNDICPMAQNLQLALRLASGATRSVQRAYRSLAKKPCGFASLAVWLHRGSSKDSRLVLGSTFLRFQEYYECPNPQIRHHAFQFDQHLGQVLGLSQHISAYLSISQLSRSISGRCHLNV